MSGHYQTESSDSNCTVSRRQALRAAGVSSAAITTIPTLVGATKKKSEKGTVRITTVKAGNEARVQKKVPADWWSHEQKADRIRLELNNQYENVPGIQGVSLGTSDETISGQQKSKLNVRVDPNGYATTIPNHIEGVKLSTEEVTETELDSSCDDDENAHEYIPGRFS